jgi:uncharacterized damage-inducible protein DinB
MTAAVALDELLEYSDHERGKWKTWVAADAGRLQLPFQAGGRFPTVWSLLDHVFLVERRHLARLEGGTPPDATGVAPGDWKALFDYADLVRAEFRRYLADLDPARAADAITFTLRDPAAPLTMTRRKLALHIVLHEVRHLAQLAYAVRGAGAPSPGDHDLFYFPEFA